MNNSLGGGFSTLLLMQSTYTAKKHCNHKLNFAFIQEFFDNLSIVMNMEIKEIYENLTNNLI